MRKRMYAVSGLALSACLTAAMGFAALAETTTYSGSAQGLNGEVKVDVTLEDGRIVDVVVDDSAETYQNVGVESMQPLVDALIEAGTTEGVDGVAGATFTSNAVLAVANEALAGGKQENAEVAYTPGVYTESAQGRNAMVTVEVEFSEDRIESVTVTDQAETASVASVALERIPAQIVEKQTTKIDTVTGATVTSGAIRSAVDAAIKEAGADPSVLPEGYAQPGEDIEKTADVIIVGGGGAGMSAAISALENGASVIVLEKTSMLGGNTVLCGGAMNAADTEWAAQFESQTGEDTALQALMSLDESEIAPEYLDDFHTLQGQIEEYLAGDTSAHFDSVELHTIQTYYYGMRQSLDGETIYGNYDLVSTMTNNAMDAVHWLEDLGIQWKDVVTQPVGGMWRRGHNPSMMHGEEYVAVLGSKITEDGGEIMFETAAKELLTDENGKVNGVYAEMADGTKVTVHANKGVILTSGGYANNLKMVQETNNYWPEIPDNTGTTNASGQKGDGIVMAQALGAATNGMEFTQLMAVSDPETGDLFTGLLPQSTADYIMVNKEGNRFVNECSPRDTLAIEAFNNGGEFYMIADINIAEDARWLSNWETEVERGNTIMADTLEELADKLGFDDETKANFLATIENYNSYVDAGNDPDFNKTALNMKVVDAPFFASPRKPALHHTMGGLTIDTTTHVLKEDGEPIEGLYAAGEVVGGIHAGNRLGGNAVADVIVFGRIAGEAVTAE